MIGSSFKVEEQRNIARHLLVKFKDVFSKYVRDMSCWASKELVFDFWAMVSRTVPLERITRMVCCVGFVFDWTANFSTPMGADHPAQDAELLKP